MRHACPGPGACGGMYTANTVASALETMDIMIPYRFSISAIHPEKSAECIHAGHAIRQLLEHDIKPRDIVTKEALRNSMVEGEFLTVTGKAIAENIAQLPGLAKGQKVVFPIENPIKQTGHLQILCGNVAPEGSVAKITGKEGHSFTGIPQVFNSEDDMIRTLENSQIKAGSVVVIRYVGPKGGPGMPEMLKPTSAIMGNGAG